METVRSVCESESYLIKRAAHNESLFLLSNHCIWTYFTIQPFSELIFGNIQIILGLQSEPELRRVSKETCQTQCCISSDSTLAKHDLVDAACIHADVNGKAVLAQVQGFDGFFQ